MKKPTPLTQKWKCVFHNPQMRAVVDPWISTEWRRKYGGSAPFGDLRNQWRSKHCRTLNPYGSDDCPFAASKCVSAYSDAVTKTLQAKPDNPMGYFIKVARVDAARRADDVVDKKIGRRYGATETNVPAAETPPHEGSGQTGDETRGLPEGRGMRSPAARPTSIGDLLGSIDFRSYPVHPDKGKEGAE